MAKKMCWVIILVTLAVNVVMLHFTIEAYFGLEYNHVFGNTIFALISSIIALISYFYWRRLEYSNEK
ncbi:hypothetical protein [Litchfieldia alkalitelluris]|uniref:hypothetical protein n=1 Tax=Litchfieldia alkalitelluris TaxID=304268 RepID=UPI000997D9D1|nr:hypothetical protein [Litchfieldia alkalitelluris]